jgi:hypothetical protein
MLHISLKWHVRLKSSTFPNARTAVGIEMMKSVEFGKERVTISFEIFSKGRVIS